MRDRDNSEIRLGIMLRASSKMGGLTPFEHGGNKCRIRKLPPIPEDFGPERYLELNPDVREGGADPVRHWQEHGYREGRPYK